MMNGFTKQKKVKGFTLVEMIVVIAIIIALLGVLTPSLMTYYHRSRVKASNADAKMVYNTAQTEIMRYANVDRTATQKSGFQSTMWISYEPGVGVKYSTAPTISGDSNMSSVSVTGGSAEQQAAAAAASAVAAKVNRLVAGASDVNWAVRVDNYIVKSSVSSPVKTSTCIGYYSANKQIAEDYSDASYSSSYAKLLGDLSVNYAKTPKS